MSFSANIKNLPFFFPPSLGILFSNQSFPLFQFKLPLPGQISILIKNQLSPWTTSISRKQTMFYHDLYSISFWFINPPTLLFYVCKGMCAIKHCFPICRYLSDLCTLRSHFFTPTVMCFCLFSWDKMKHRWPDTQSTNYLFEILF